HDALPINAGRRIGRGLSFRWRDGAPGDRPSCNSCTRRGAAMNISAWSIRYPVPVILLFAMLTVAGLIAFRGTEVQNFPDVDLPMVRVVASLPGTAPAQLETEVARKLENAMATLQGLRHLHTLIQD